MSQCTLNRALFYFSKMCLRYIYGMLKFVFGLRSWPAQSTTRRNYSSIVDPVSGSSALCANYAVSTPDTKSCRWCTRIRPWRYDPRPSSRSGQGSLCRTCLTKPPHILWEKFLFYAGKSCITLSDLEHFLLFGKKALSGFGLGSLIVTHAWETCSVECAVHSCEWPKVKVCVMFTVSVSFYC